MKPTAMNLFRVPIGFVLSTRQEMKPAEARKAIIESVQELLTVAPREGRWLTHDPGFDKNHSIKLASTAAQRSWTKRRLISKQSAKEYVEGGREVDFHLMVRESAPADLRPGRKVALGRPTTPRNLIDASLVEIVTSSEGRLGALLSELERLKDELNQELHIEDPTATAFILHRRGGKKWRELPTERAKVLDELIRGLEQRVSRERTRLKKSRSKRRRVS
jgi:hypothetical protein